jgi:predicted metal-dependent phosphoesterase TrpH
MYVDMHSHSVSSDDSRATVEQYMKWIQVVRKKGNVIDAVVLTEHRKFDLDADYSALAEEYGVRIFKGSELDTYYGHFLVYGVTQELLNVMDFGNVRMDSHQLMSEARKHGALAVPAHPGRPGVGLCGFIADGVEFPDVGIVETHNGGARKGENEKAIELAENLGYRGIGGSDAHLVSAIAACMTSFSGDVRNEQDLVEALLSGDFMPVRLEETAAGNG